MCILGGNHMIFCITDLVKAGHFLIGFDRLYCAFMNFIVDVPDYCQAHPTDVLPDPNNCAHYFNCSDRSSSMVTRAANQNSVPGNYRKECKYPQLFGMTKKRCRNFENVTCGNRTEPQAPCKCNTTHM